MAHEFYAQGNTATTQIFIGQLGSMNLDPQRTRSAPSAPPASRTYPVHTREGCREFVEQYKNSEYLAVAIVLSVFEPVYLSDLHELNALLMEELSVAGPPEENARPAPVYWRDVLEFLTGFQGKLGRGSVSIWPFCTAAPGSSPPPRHNERERDV